jgi:hypothetical protein
MSCKYNIAKCRHIKTLTWDTESRTTCRSVVHSYLPEVLDPGPGQANHDEQKDEGDGGYREKDSLDCGT